jgi:hypothetical protein
MKILLEPPNAEGIARLVDTAAIPDITDMYGVTKSFPAVAESLARRLLMKDVNGFVALLGGAMYDAACRPETYTAAIRSERVPPDSMRTVSE